VNECVLMLVLVRRLPIQQYRYKDTNFQLYIKRKMRISRPHYYDVHILQDDDALPTLLTIGNGNDGQWFIAIFQCC
jgi:hypothetical protein